MVKTDGARRWGNRAPSVTGHAPEVSLITPQGPLGSMLDDGAVWRRENIRRRLSLSAVPLTHDRNERVLGDGPYRMLLQAARVELAGALRDCVQQQRHRLTAVSTAATRSPTSS